MSHHFYILKQGNVLLSEVVQCVYVLLRGQTAQIGLEQVPDVGILYL